MIPDSIVHQHENSEWSEQFMKDNGAKFNADCIVVLRLLYKGMRLTAKNVNDLTGMADGGRRLRDIHHFRKDCKKAIRKKPGGGLEGVEYWLDISYPTKSATIERAGKVIDLLTKTEKNLVTVFSLPDSTETKPDNYKQQELF